MNLLHSLVATLIENFPAVLGALYACFRLGVLLSYLTAVVGLGASAHKLLRRSPRSA
jgi:hypothetical protein